MIEWKRLFLEHGSPGLFLKGLRDQNRLPEELEKLRDVPQSPIHHPEGCALTHTIMVVDAEADVLSREGVSGDRRIYLMLSALCHDMGKATHTRWHEKKQKWVSYGHDIAGVPIALAFLKREGLEEYADYVLPLVLNHMSQSRSSWSIKSVKKIVDKLGKASVEDLCLLMEADYSGRGYQEGRPNFVDSLGAKELIPLLISCKP